MSRAPTTTTATWRSAVSGDWATAADWSSNAAPNSTATNVTIAAAGSYVVTIGTTEDFLAGTLTIGAGPALDIAGTLDIAALAGGSVAIARRGILQTGGTITGTIVNNGLIDALQSTTLTIDPGGSGNLAVGTAATLTLATADDERVDFTGPRATLLLDAPAQFTGMIYGFEQTDTIGLVGITASSVQLDGSALDVFSGNSLVDQIPLATDYAGANFSVTQNGSTALISETGITYSVEGETWGGATITWAFADTTFATDEDDGNGFADFVTQTADQAIFEQAIAEWASITGLTFVEVADTGSEAGAPDIRIGWGSFDGTEIGEADFSDQGTTLLPDVLVRLEDPAIDPIDTSSGTPLYSGTESSVLGVALHELGHAIGLDHTTDPDAIMNPTATSSNRQLDASDIAAAEALYPADVACYAAGTRILTESGARAIETLRPGERVRSALTGALVPVIWIGHRTVTCAGHLRPIRVRAHSFGPDAPCRDLLLSPDHAVRRGDALIPIRLLADGAAIAPCDIDRITYWHVELPRHDLVFAEGLAAESYLDTGNRGRFSGHGLAAIMAHSHAHFCLPLQLGGAAVAAARRHIADRAWARHGITVRGDGAVLDPVRHRGVRAVFLVPPGICGLSIEGDPLACLLDGRPSPGRSWQLGRRGAVLELLVPGEPTGSAFFFEKKNQKTSIR